jgi:hypothetical protein
MNVTFWPAKAQWKGWTLPSKATFVGTVVPILMGIFAILTYLFGSSPQVSQEASGNIQISGGTTQGNLTTGNNITATASEGGTAVIITGNGHIYIELVASFANGPKPLVVCGEIWVLPCEATFFT